MSHTDSSAGRPQDDFQVGDLSRPAPALLRYYLLCSCLAGPLLPIVFIPLLCKYLTLQYRFDDSGVAMKWGVLFRREIYLTYRRIQDIHLTRNILQRWLGLATLDVQTASGSSTPEMSIEGILEAEPLRDHLYAMMRGSRGDLGEGANESEGPDETLVILTEIRDSMRQLAGTAVSDHE